jgi:hypothetical protein
MAHPERSILHPQSSILKFFRGLTAPQSTQEHTMISDPITLFSSARTAFPKYAALLDALAGVIAADAPVLPPVVPVIPPAPTIAPDLSVLVGQPLFLDGGGALFRVDFGDPAGRFPALRGYNAAHVYDSPGNFTAKITRDPSTSLGIGPSTSLGTGPATPLGPGPSTSLGTNPANLLGTVSPDSTQAVHVLADTRPQILLNPGDDLAKAIGQLKDNTILILPAGATFDLTATAVISASGITLRAAAPSAATPQPASGPRIRRIASPGSYSALSVSGHDVSIEGIEFDSDRPLDGAGGKVGVYAITFGGRNLLVRRCNFRNIDDAIHTLPGAQNLMALDCTFTNELRAYGAYLDAMKGVAILGCTSAGSKNEHPIRVDGAQNVLLEANDLTSTTDKECLAVREGRCVAIADNTFRSWVRVSQGAPPAMPINPAPAPGQPTTPATNAPATNAAAFMPAAPACQHILLAANHFAGLHPAGVWLQINPGSDDVWIDANRFDADERQSCVAVQAPSSNIRLTNNAQAMVNGAKTTRPLVTPVNGGQFVESGTTIA